MRFFFSLISTLQLLEYANEGFLTGPPFNLLPRENISVGIIGAGFAGLSAYNQLFKRGFSNVHLFEASQRVGGRVFPLAFEGIFLQHGAEFINGKNNPIYEMAERLGLITGQVDDSEMIAGRKALFASCAGCHVASDTMAKFARFTDELELKYAEIAASESKRWDVSVGSLFENDFAAFLKTEKAVTGEKRTEYESLAQMYRNYYEGEWSAPINQLALHNYAQWRDGSQSFPFGSFTLDSRGYAPILEELSRNIPLEKLHFGKRVVNIDYSEEKIHLKLQNTVEAHNGFEKWPDSFDFIIVTVPIGHLKCFGHSMFTPPLPTTKLDAIRAIGFGQMQKLFLVYERPFWDANMGSLVALNCANRGGTDLLKDSLHTFQPHPWASNKILVAWLSGNGPRQLNGVEDEQLALIVTEHLRELLPNNTRIDMPKRIIRTKWLDDDLFLGSYTFITPEASIKFGPDPFAILAAPIFDAKGEKPRLLFAGEGTHSQMFQTTIGAFLSGRQEADRLAQYFDDVGERMWKKY